MMNLIILLLGQVLISQTILSVGGTCTNYPANNGNGQLFSIRGLYLYQASSNDIILSQSTPTSTGTLPNNTYYNYQGLFCYCGLPTVPSFVPLFEYFFFSPTAGQRHVYTTNPSEFPASYINQFTLTGTVCYVSLVPFDEHVPAYRFWNGATGTFLYTTNPTDGTNYPAYWTLQALPFYVGATDYNARPFYPVPLYRYRHATSSDTYLTTVTNDPLASTPSESYTYIGVLGSCYPYAHNGWFPIFQYASGTLQTGRHHVYTTNWTLLGGGANGFTYQGIPCYVQLTPTANTLPTYQFSNSQPPSKISTLLYTTNSSEPAGDTQVTTWTLVDIPWYMFVNATCDSLSNPLSYLYRYQTSQSTILLALYPISYPNNGTLTNVGMAYPFPVGGLSPILSYTNQAMNGYYTSDWTAIGGGGGSSGYTFAGILGYIFNSTQPNTHPLYRFILNAQPLILDYSVNMTFLNSSVWTIGTVGYPYNSPSHI